MSELSVNLNAGVTHANQRDPHLQADFELMQRVAQGDDSAMVDLLDQHGEMLARLIGRLIAWHTDCDDVLQDVLLSIWQNAGSYRGQGSLEGWLKRMAVNRCNNRFRNLRAIQRKIERFATLVVRSKLPQKTQTYPLADNQSEPNEDLSRALAELSQSDRTAIVLFYMEELPGEEVAKTLGIKTETLHVRLHRIRKKLKHKLQELES